MSPRGLKSLRWLLDAEPGSAARLRTDHQLDRELESLLGAYRKSVLGSELRSAELLERIRSI